MNESDRAALEQLSETISTPGWDLLADDVEAKIEAIKEELTQPRAEINGDLLRIAQGRILAYRDILSLPHIVKHAFEEEANAEAADLDE